MKKTQLLTLLLCFCSLAAVGATPQWIGTKPRVEGYYTGVGSAPSSAPDKVEKARTAALADLVGDISLSVSADMRQSAVQAGDDFTELFTYDVRTHSDAYLEGHELVDSYDDGTDYWVYYRLSRKKYEEVLARRVAGASARAYECDRRGREAAAAGDFSGAVALFVEGLEVALPFASKNPSHGGVGVLPALQKDLSALLAGVAVTLTPSSADVVPLSAQALTVSVLLQSGETPIAGIPLAVRFTEGEGKLTTPPATSAQGVSTFSVSDITSRDPVQSVLVSADLSSLLARYDASPVAGLLHKCLPEIPQGVLTLRVSAPSLTAWCRYKKPYDDEAVLRSISSYLSSNYFEMAPDAASADVLVDVTVDYRPGDTVKGELYDMREGFISCRVELTDRATGNVAATFGIDDVRTLSPVKDTETKVRKQAARELLRKLKPEMKRRMASTRFQRRASATSSDDED